MIVTTGYVCVVGVGGGAGMPQRACGSCRTTLGSRFSFHIHVDSVNQAQVIRLVWQMLVPAELCC